MSEEIGGSRNVEHHYYTCFPPVGRWGVLFCGTALVIIGAAWLSSNLGFISEDWWEVAIPVLCIGWGAAVLFGSRATDWR